MTLNYSARPIFTPQNPAEGNFLSSSLRERVSGEGPGRYRRFYWEVDETYNYGRDRGGADRTGSCEPVYNDIADLLPADPFGMELSTTWTAAIASWIEDLAMDDHYTGEYLRDMNEDYPLALGFDYFCNRGLMLPSELGMNPDGSIDSVVIGLPELPVREPHGERFVLVLDVEGGFQSCGGAGEDQSMILQPEELRGHVEVSCSSGDGGCDPHDAILFSLAYLGVRDLLSAEMACRTLHSAIQNDPLLWRCIHIDTPLSKRITDGALLRLTERARGSLDCLSLVACSRVTGDGLKRVLESNPKLRKLSVPGCTRLSVDSLMGSLRIFKSPGMPGIKHLRISGLYGIRQEHLEELKLLLGVDKCQQPKARKPRFYHSNWPSSCHDESAIDIESCPRCQNVRLVYDCPAESCRVNGSQPCRACAVCISRCVQCGRCIDDLEYEETFCLDKICLSCANHIRQSQERQGEKRFDPDKLILFSGRAGIHIGYSVG